MITFILIYWIATTIVGVIWLVKNPSHRHGDDPEYITLLDIFGMILPAMLVAWVVIPFMLLNQIKFRRRRSSLKTTEERMQNHFAIVILIAAGLLSAVLTFLILQLR